LYSDEHEENLSPFLGDWFNLRATCEDYETDFRDIVLGRATGVVTSVWVFFGEMAEILGWRYIYSA
jgi:hypothetical protein